MEKLNQSLCQYHFGFYYYFTSTCISHTHTYIQICKFTCIYKYYICINLYIIQIYICWVTLSIFPTLHTPHNFINHSHFFIFIFILTRFSIKSILNYQNVIDNNNINGKSERINEIKLQLILFNENNIKYKFFFVDKILKKKLFPIQ